MVTRRIGDDLPEDKAILRHIVRDLNQCVGVYARVVEVGTVSVGDTMTFL
jgi:MOSC domain-containing protein YiiM